MQHITESKSYLNMLQSTPAAEPYQQGRITLTLENADLWKAFHHIGTEMIITKHGRRMFPHCNISLSGLQPHVNYVIMVDMIPVDSFRYKWNKEQWEVAGKAEPQPPCRTYMHPNSPATGSHWMSRSVSFLKMKLTNNTLDQHGHIIMHSMHRYFPRFHVIQADSPYTVCWGPFQTFSFPETSFTAVTAYQNIKITKLKIDHNPFAKGFREGGTHFHGKRCRSNKSPSYAEKKAKLDGKALCKSPPDLQRAPSASQSVKARKSLYSPEKSFKEGLSPWAVEQDPSESLHMEPLELHGQDYSCGEQMVPAPMAYHPYRFAEHSRLPSPSSGADDCHGMRSFASPVVQDVATVPGHDQADRADQAGHQQRAAPVQNPAAAPCQGSQLDGNAPASCKTNPGVPGYPRYRHGSHQAEYGVGQWGEGEGGGQFTVHALAHPAPHLLPAPEHGAHQHGYHHYSNAAEWSQYPLFSYSLHSDDVVDLRLKYYNS
ncbi:T-box-containing protein TBX6L-like [Polymixia lowei]